MRGIPVAGEQDATTRTQTLVVAVLYELDRCRAVMTQERGESSPRQTSPLKIKRSQEVAPLSIVYSVYWRKSKISKKWGYECLSSERRFDGIAGAVRIYTDGTTLGCATVTS